MNSVIYNDIIQDKSGSITYHQTEVTDFHLFFHFGQDMRVQSFSKKHHIGPQQAMTVNFLTPSHIR